MQHKRGRKINTAETKKESPKKNQKNREFNRHKKEKYKDPLLGETIANRYKIEKIIGAGGMGKVYYAKDQKEDQYVAIKVLQDVAGNPRKAESFARRFKREAEAMKLLNHENIVKIFEYGKHGDSEYISMEYLEGKTLSAYLSNEKVFDSDTVRKLMVPLCDALQKAHKKNLIHRDLKPGNIFITKNGKKKIPKILDFGLVKNEHNIETVITKTGTYVGTPTYSSPEQCEGKKEITFSSDIYSLGVIMYRMLCGKVPIRGESDQDTMIKHIREIPDSPTEARPDLDIPKEMDWIVMKALEKKPLDRFKSMKELKEALKDPEAYVENEKRNLGRKYSDETTGYLSAAISIEAEAPKRKSAILGKLVGTGIIGAALAAGIYYYDNLREMVFTDGSGEISANAETGNSSDLQQRAYQITITTNRTSQIYLEEILGNRTNERFMGETRGRDHTLTITVPSGSNNIIIRRGRRSETITVTEEGTHHLEI